MAVAVKNKVDGTQTVAGPQQLAIASFVGAIYLIASTLVVFVGLPWAWTRYVTPSIDSIFGAQTFVNTGGLLTAGTALAIALFVGFRAIAGIRPPAGFRAGVSLAISLLITSFFLTIALTEWLRGVTGIVDRQTGSVLLGVVAAVLVGGSVSLMLGTNTQKALIAVEEQGWFSLSSYKKSQGVRVRRFTMLGVLLIIGTGIWSLMSSRVLFGDWVIPVPYLDTRLTVLPSTQWTVPLILTAVGLWFAWRLVNTPNFADFLIATDAELNKVSWTSRKQLIRDTIVVLVAVFLLTLFLLVVDQVWGLIFRSIGIVPPLSKTTGDAVREASW